MGSGAKGRALPCLLPGLEPVWTATDTQMEGPALARACQWAHGTLHSQWQLRAGTPSSTLQGGRGQRPGAGNKGRTGVSSRDREQNRVSGQQDMLGSWLPPTQALARGPCDAGSQVTNQCSLGLARLPGLAADPPWARRSRRRESLHGSLVAAGLAGAHRGNWGAGTQRPSPGVAEASWVPGESVGLAHQRGHSQKTV